jgi:hypothetical protein
MFALVVSSPSPPSALCTSALSLLLHYNYNFRERFNEAAVAIVFFSKSIEHFSSCGRRGREILKWKKCGSKHLFSVRNLILLFFIIIHRLPIENQSKVK